MSFKYACFVSYRHHEQSQLAERFVLDLCSALRNELTVRVDEELYVDRERMNIGTMFNAALAGALCRSVCMVLIYTPTYFSRQHLYCAREYRAMEAIERDRLSHLPEAAQRECGLILPVVLRGMDSLPAVLHGARHCYDFEGFSLTSRTLARNRAFEGAVRKMAQVIHERKRLLDGVGKDLTCFCEGFDFPTEDEVRPWVETLGASAAARLPFRGA